MKISRKSPKYTSSLQIRQFPWNLNKMIKFKRRKWARIKFSLAKQKTTRILNFKIFLTYKKKTKKLIKRYFASNLTARQCNKLFNLNSRYKATYKRILKSEYRFDTLVFRLYMLPNIIVARTLILKNYFKINGKAITVPKMIIQIGDIVEPSNTIAWNFLYLNMLTVVASLKKYFNRIFFKLSFPFVVKKNIKNIN